ncbi:hypothetical protein BS17DRAFT_455306 [Gyrodon lividus]|nr:hypothetical protein BS17DRAFT_455306 [Gyrodon lividus]
MSASQRTTKECNSRPPRLQPSPSLPNLRARNMSSESHLTQSQTTLHKLSTHISSPSPADLSYKIPFKEGDLHPTKRSRQHSKNQHYLTPPLTPASSLKSDSTDPDSADLIVPSQEQAASASQNIAPRDVGQSRFLIVEISLHKTRSELMVT